MNYIERPLTEKEQLALQELMIDVSLFLEGTTSLHALRTEWERYTVGKDAPLGELEWDLEVLNG